MRAAIGRADDAVVKWKARGQPIRVRVATTQRNETTT